MKILFIDDHQVFRQGLTSLIQNEEYCQSIYSCGSLKQARDYLEKDTFDLLITDLNLSNETGQELLTYCSIHYPAMKLICLTMLSDLSNLTEVLALGVKGYVTKSSGFSELSTAIQIVQKGGIYFDQDILSQVVRYLTRQVNPSVANPLAILSAREIEIFNQFVQNFGLDEIAEKLCISRKTVENHRSNIYKKLKIKDRLSLNQFAKKYDLIL